LRTIVLHSYKGGTGKTILSANIAAEAARRGLRVGLFDLDLRAPSLSTLFNYEPERYVNDYFRGDITLNEAIIDLSPIFDLEGHLWVAFSSPEIQVIRRMIAKSGTYHINMLKALLTATKKLQDESKLDLLVFDSSPGIEPWSVNAIIAADITFIVLKPSLLDRMGTQRMLQGIYQQLPKDKTFYLIFNRFVTGTNLEAIANAHVRATIYATIPCYCDHVIASDEEVFVLTKPEHPFSQDIKKLVDILDDQFSLRSKEVVL
jgi:MinD-like ATPase involved in chromosome partitioning or flagellar assembly